MMTQQKKLMGEIFALDVNLSALMSWLANFRVNLQSFEKLPCEEERPDGHSLSFKVYSPCIQAGRGATSNPAIAHRINCLIDSWQVQHSLEC